MRVRIQGYEQDFFLMFTCSVFFAAGMSLQMKSSMIFIRSNRCEHRVLVQKRKKKKKRFPSESKKLSKKSVSIVNMPALSTLLGVESAGKIRVGFTIDTDFFDNFFDLDGNLFFFFLFYTKTLWVRER